MDLRVHADRREIVPQSLDGLWGAIGEEESSGVPKSKLSVPTKCMSPSSIM